MAYFGKLASKDLLMHAIRSVKAVGKPVFVRAVRRIRNGEYLRRRRASMYLEQLGLCHWCKEQMVLVDFRTGRKGDDSATIEHLDPRHSAERGKHPGERRLVLAHWRCNNERDREQLAKLPLQTLWERSGQIIDIAKRSGALNEVDYAE